KLYWYTTGPDSTANMIPVPVDRVREIQEMNKKGRKPRRILTNVTAGWEVSGLSGKEDEEYSITRFDTPVQAKKKRRHSRKKKNRKFNEKKKN
ncbi:MAG: hypothetical protein GX876_10245, partial [Bacteroidales bacterium]|nr:hypothetical protein [Bacteroidales bacterium]